MMGKLLKSKIFRPVLRTMFIMTLMTSFMTVAPAKRAEAVICCKGCGTCYSSIIAPSVAGWLYDWLAINLYIFIRLAIHRIIWFDWEYWQLHLLPMLMMAGEQLAAVGTQQVTIIGQFLDATEQLQTQRLLQELKAKAHKEYHPSIGMCEFGTRVKSLAASERKGEIDELVLSERSVDRMFGNTGGVAAKGISKDAENRIEQFRKKFCYTLDNGNGLDLMCPGRTATSLLPADINRINKDVDYGRTIQDPLTVDVDLSNGIAFTPDEEDIFALQANLYSPSVFIRPGPQDLQNDPRKSIQGIQQAYLDARAYVAKNSVAEDSFNALVALKAAGTDGSKQFFKAYLKELGVPSDELDRYLGQNPSYDAQMKLLTKTIYQRSKFYTNLMDTPENVRRKAVAMQAIGLMQKFDLFKSYLRTEASLSVILELSIEKLQGEIEDAIGSAIDVDQAN